MSKEPQVSDLVAIPTSDTAEPVSVMGILNVTPDSFSDGGENMNPDIAVQRALQMISEGASVIDIGGESTRPGADPVDPVAEQARVIPVIRELTARVADLGMEGVRVSIDTRNAATARAAVEAGADLINDVSASLWTVAAECGVGWVAMHMLGDPRTMQVSPNYVDVVQDVRAFLIERASIAVQAGVGEVWVDPGIGFGKTTRHNLEILARLDELVAEGFPVLVGTSRKRFLGELSDHSDAWARAATRRISGRDRARSVAPESDPIGSERPSALGVPVTDRLEASVATAMWSMARGAKMVRVHDVAPTAEAVCVLQGSIPGG